MLTSCFCFTKSPETSIGHFCIAGHPPITCMSLRGPGEGCRGSDMKWVSTAQTIRGWGLDVNEDQEFVWSLPSVEIYTSQGEVTVSPPPLRNRNKEKFSCVLFFWVQRSVGFKVTIIQILKKLNVFQFCWRVTAKKAFGMRIPSKIPLKLFS